jgi:hypothetical protein
MTREKVEGKEFVDLNTWNNILRRKENLDLFTSKYSSCVTSVTRGRNKVKICKNMIKIIFISSMLM